MHTKASDPAIRKDVQTDVADEVVVMDLEPILRVTSED
jgi:hypothetical protein